ncbi:MAG TPA: TIGR02300 family protein [Devosia sp.]|nr:TIGR02300 family protein [Devosia sp.]
MASADRGTKRQCLHCGTKYYDLNRDPVLCPVCQKPYEPPAELKPRKSPAESDATQTAKDDGIEESVVDPAAAEADAEIVSFEEAETGDEDDRDVDTGEDIPDVDDVEDIGGEVDNSFVDDDDDDAADIGLDVSTAKNEE